MLTPQHKRGHVIPIGPNGIGSLPLPIVLGLILGRQPLVEDTAPTDALWKKTDFEAQEGKETCILLSHSRGMSLYSSVVDGGSCSQWLEDTGSSTTCPTVARLAGLVLTTISSSERDRIGNVVA